MDISWGFIAVVVTLFYAMTLPRMLAGHIWQPQGWSRWFAYTDTWIPGRRMGLLWYLGALLFFALLGAGLALVGRGELASFWTSFTIGMTLIFPGVVALEANSKGVRDGISIAENIWRRAIVGRYCDCDRNSEGDSQELIPTRLYAHTRECEYWRLLWKAEESLSVYREHSPEDTVDHRAYLDDVRSSAAQPSQRWTQALPSPIGRALELVGGVIGIVFFAALAVAFFAVFDVLIEWVVDAWQGVTR